MTDQTDTEDGEIERKRADVGFVEDVIAHALRDPDYAKIAIPLLDPKLMPTPTHEWAVSVIRETFDSHKEMPDMKLAAALAGDLKSPEESADAKLLWIKLEAHRPRAPRAALEQIRKFSYQAALELQWERTGMLIAKGKYAEADALMQQAVKHMDVMSDVQISRWMETFEKRQERRMYERDNPDATPHVKTGWEGLDKHMNGGAGVRIGQCGGILAVTNMGKSVVAVNFGFVAATAGHRVIHVSTEMTVDEVDTRYDSRFTGIAADKFPHYKFTDQELKRIAHLLKEKRARYEKMLTTISMPIDATTKTKVISAFMQAREEMGGCDLFVFDSPDHLRSERSRGFGGKEAYRLEQASNFWWMKSFCQEVKCAGWCTVQAGSQAAGGIATNEDISESYDKARILDFIFSLNAASKTDRSTPRHEVNPDEWDGGEEISVGTTGLRGFLDKNRHGPAKIDIPLYAELDKMLIIDGDISDELHKQKPERKYKK